MGDAYTFLYFHLNLVLIVCQYIFIVIHYFSIIVTFDILYLAYYLKRFQPRTIRSANSIFYR